MSGAARSPPDSGRSSSPAATSAIADAVEAAGGRAVTDRSRLTRPGPTASMKRSRISTRVARFDAVINVQGDLPLLDPAAVRVAARRPRRPRNRHRHACRRNRGRSRAPRDQRQQGRRRLCRSGAAGARALFQQGGGAVGRRAALRAYRALRLSARGAGAVCRAAAGRARTARASRAVARARGRDAHLGQPDRGRPARGAGRHPGRSRARPRNCSNGRRISMAHPTRQTIAFQGALRRLFRPRLPPRLSRNGDACLAPNSRMPSPR